MKSAHTLRAELMGRDFTDARRAAKATRDRLMGEAKRYAPGDVPPAVARKRALVSASNKLSKPRGAHVPEPVQPPQQPVAASIWDWACYFKP